MRWVQGLSSAVLSGRVVRGQRSQGEGGPQTEKKKKKKGPSRSESGPLPGAPQLTAWKHMR